VKAYYHARAAEYDDWYLGAGGFADRDRPGWEDELKELRATIEALPPARTLDVACGTGFLTRHLRGEVVGLDQSERMLDVARVEAPAASYVRGDGLALPFGDDSFSRVFTGHFYGHLEEGDRQRFLVEARRVARELVIVDASIVQGGIGEEWQRRVLKDGSEWQVFKRYFTGRGLAAELGGGEVLFEGRWFVVAAA
jgi:ubiquinone/menaquinone biosynthesis C-methylase UbiE